MTPDAPSPAGNPAATRTPHPPAVLDQLLTAQLIVAWAGERGDPQRLGWWRSDLSSEFGGEDLFRRLLPHTWPWATLKAPREVGELPRHLHSAKAYAVPRHIHILINDNYIACAQRHNAGRSSATAQTNDSVGQ